MGRPKPPDPMQTARQQQTFNRESQADAAQLGQIGQDTPWGSRSFSGEIGSPTARRPSRSIRRTRRGWIRSARSSPDYSA